MHIKDIVKDVKHWMSFIPYKPVEEVYRAGFMAGLTIPPYELPDGTKINNNEMICTAAEKWFLPKNKNSNGNSPNSVSVSNGNNNTNNSNKNGSSSSSSGSSSINGNGNKTIIPSIETETIIDYDTETLQSLVHHCLTKCDNDVKKDLLSNIVIVGGGSLIDGVSNRLTYELNEIVPSNMKVKCHFIYFLFSCFILFFFMTT